MEGSCLPGAQTNRRPYLTSTVLLLAVTIPLTGLLLLTRTRRRQSRGSPANAACRREWRLGCHRLPIQMRFSIARRSWTRNAGSCVRRVSLQRCADADPRLDSRGPHLRHTPHAELPGTILRRGVMAWIRQRQQSGDFSASRFAPWLVRPAGYQGRGLSRRPQARGPCVCISAGSPWPRCHSRERSHPTSGRDRRS
jgi:hypothetical protein